MKRVSETLQVYDQEDNLVAQVVLNGYTIKKGGPLGRHGAMSSFKIVEGDLYEQWDEQQALTLRSPAGLAQVRVMALPVEDDSFGLLEFL